MIIDNDLVSMQQARILAEDAFAAQKKLALFSQERLDAIVEAVAAAVEGHARELAVLSREETGYGNWRDKRIKNQFVCGYVRRHLRGMRCVGFVGGDRDAGTLDIGVPLGVIAALCPVTSPVSTTIYKTLLAIKSGNAIIFSPHPGAAECIGKTLDIMIAAAHEHGLPEDCVSRLHTVTASGTLELLRHPHVSLIMITGAPAMFEAARRTDKPVIYGGTGNGPAFVERSADIGRAARDIILSKTFDNGIAPSAEHSVVVEACVEAEFKAALAENGAYFMNAEEAAKLAGLLFLPEGRRRKGVVGQTARYLAERAGIAAPEGVTVLVADRRYVSDTDPYSRELLAPVFPCFVEADWRGACEKCIELLLHIRNAHSLVIHSGDEEVVRQFALKKPVGRLLVNTPAAFGGIGATTGLFPAMTLGGGAAGYGITADNVSPLNLIYIRKVGYGLRNLDGSARDIPGAQSGPSQRIRALQQILAQAVTIIDKSGDR
ncbi:MAG: aldehyde dehydrogenase family protein [Desulfovibrio sp.]|jgi:acyl-CoA reductase-like NAD-dependent aldehyde dehydrogenase|nr:aldehyde dehydrogenase family protein [Desulfovibrio sp.]